MKLKVVMVLIAAAVGLGACGNETKEQKAPERPTAEAPADTSQQLFEVRGFQDAAVQTNGTAFTVQRAGERRQGLSILPRDPNAPARIDFTVEGAGATVSYYRGGQWTELPAQASYGLRLGNGGAFHILVVPPAGQPATVHVTGATACRGAPEGTCPPL